MVAATARIISSVIGLLSLASQINTDDPAQAAAAALVPELAASVLSLSLRSDRRQSSKAPGGGISSGSVSLAQQIAGLIPDSDLAQAIRPLGSLLSRHFSKDTQYSAASSLQKIFRRGIAPTQPDHLGRLVKRLAKLVRDNATAHVLLRDVALGALASLSSSAADLCNAAMMVKAGAFDALVQLLSPQCIAFLSPEYLRIVLLLLKDVVRVGN